MDYQYLVNLPVDQLLSISFKFLQDLKEGHDRENQTPQNSSRPSASFPLWQAKPDKPSVEENQPQDPEKKADECPVATTLTQKNESQENRQPIQKAEKKKPGKQIGAQGHGRQIELEVTGIEHHRACECVACGQSLTEESQFDARGGLYVLDLEIGSLGLEVTHIKHLYGDTHCSCGHVTQTMPRRCQPESGWQVKPE